MSPIGERLKKLELANKAGGRLIGVSVHRDSSDNDAATALRDAGIVPADRDLVVQLLKFGEQDGSFAPHVVRVSPL